MGLTLFKGGLFNEIINTAVGVRYGGVEKSSKPFKCIGYGDTAIKKLLMKSKVIQWHSFSFAVSQDIKKNRMKSKRGMKNPQNLF